jgi:hypothetical protein
LARIFAGLAAEDPEQTAVMIDATYLKTYRTATSLRVKTYGPPRLQALFGSWRDQSAQTYPACRSAFASAAKMEIRASRSS